MQLIQLFKLWLLVLLAVCAFESSAADLYTASTYQALASDRRAYRVGDILTVQILENSSASATADTKTDKSSDWKFGLSDTTKQHSAGLNSSDDFDGGGKITRSGKLLAQLSVKVIAIAANGDLQIQGDQLIEINGEKQEIRLEGVVRRSDISENNTVLSNRIANAKINYVGDGVLAESQHRGWLAKLITWLGLF